MSNEQPNERACVVREVSTLSRLFGLSYLESSIIERICRRGDLQEARELLNSLIEDEDGSGSIRLGEGVPGESPLGYLSEELNKDLAYYQAAHWILFYRKSPLTVSGIASEIQSRSVFSDVDTTVLKDGLRSGLDDHSEIFKKTKRGNVNVWSLVEWDYN